MTTSSTNQHDRPVLRSELALAACLVSLIVACRWGIDVPNFKPVMAVAMLSGFLFSRKWIGIATVVSGMLISDALIGFYELAVSMTVYFCLVLPLACGLLLSRWKGHALKLSTGVLGFAGLTALNFFVLTTLAVWYFTPWYPTTFAGLETAFIMGLPFLKWTLAGNVFFSALLFGIAGMANQLDSRQKKRGVPVKVYSKTR